MPTNINTNVFEKYAFLKKAYDNNNLYDTVTEGAINDNIWIEALKPMRTSVNRSVEFYVAKIFPSNDIEIATEFDNIIEPIQQITKWSNFAAKKQLFLRNLALFGDLFLKVTTAGDSDKIHYENIDPALVTDFRTDSRGFLQWIRIDTPIRVDTLQKLHTEFWTKDTFSVWIHNRTRTTALDQLGDPIEFGFTAELGIDFVPFVHIKFRDTGALRGKACTEHAIDKITESNRQATRLAQMLFRYNKPHWAISTNSVDPDGNALPAPRQNSGDGLDVTFSDDVITYLPGNSKLESLVPDINYGDALSILNSMMNELEQDLPELKYYSLKDGNLSGKAVSLLLGGALDRAKEARNNFIQGLVRLNEMALTMGRFNGIFSSNIGDFDAGDFVHDIRTDELFGTTLEEKAEIVKNLVSSGIILKQAMEIAGFDIEDVEEEEN